MDAHQRLSHIIQRTKLKYGNSAIIAVLHFSHSRVFTNKNNSYPKMNVNFILNMTPTADVARC
jgi:hypothetical protein